MSDRAEEEFESTAGELPRAVTTHRRSAAREIGAPRPRVEDRRLLTGDGRFTDDTVPEGLARAFVVRSPHAHARIRSIDGCRAAGLPGVLAVLTGEDAAADGMRPIPHDPDWTGPPDVELRLPEGFDVTVTPNLPLPLDTVRYCGEAVPSSSRRPRWPPPTRPSSWRWNTSPSRR